MLDAQQVQTIVLGITQSITGQPNLKLESPLLGAIAEFDSSAILTLLTLIEDQFGIYFNDDELAAEHFSSVSRVCQFVMNKLS